MNRLEVTSSQLKTISDQFKGAANQIKSITGEMLSTVKSINSAWEGDAANAYKKQFAQLETDMNEMYKMIMEYDSDLDEIAAEYNRVEQANEQIAQALKTDVVTM